MKERLVNNKGKITTIVLIIVILLFLLLLKSCNGETQEETSDYQVYKSHVIESDKKQKNLLIGLGQYLTSIDFSCDEDTAKQLETYANQFSELSVKHKELTYIGDENTADLEVYSESSKTYASISEVLRSIAKDIRDENISGVNSGFDELLILYKTLGEGE